MIINLETKEKIHAPGAHIPPILGVYTKLWFGVYKRYTPFP